ncbi:MAG: PIN domain-containing protein [Candidatus Diapherotrites archaeon]|nr:PIN domain-containing protein [Candidatus Diapherotrites archaeon]
MTNGKLLLDSNVWLGYFLEDSAQIKSILESNAHHLSCSVLSLHEIAKILGKNGFRQQQIINAVEFIRQNAALLDVTEQIALQAVRYCEENRLHTADSLIYATAIHENALFVTADHHFEGLPQTQIIQPDSR